MMDLRRQDAPPSIHRRSATVSIGNDSTHRNPPSDGALARRLARRLHQRAQPIPDAVLFRPTMVFAPHPDDETLGCGGTIRRLTEAGVPVHLIVMTDGRGSHAHLMPGGDLAALRSAEVVAAAAALGLTRDDVELLGIEEPRLRERSAFAAEKVEAILKARRPAQVLIPYRRDPHVDHRTTAELVSRVASTLDAPPTIWEYPIWLWDHWPWTRAWHLTAPGRARWALQGPARAYHLLTAFRHRVDVRSVLDAKREALRRHVTQTTRVLPNPRWMTLGDVAQGRWLARFFSGDELFAGPGARS